MDFSKENVDAAEKADIAYAYWYSRLPDERKVEFFNSGYEFVAEKVRSDVQQKNPFATQAEILSRFISLTQKDAYPEETFNFIQEKMASRSEKEWQQRFKKMKKALGWSYEDMATFMQAGSGAAVKSSVNRKLPAFAKLAVCVFEQLYNEKNAR